MASPDDTTQRGKPQSTSDHPASADQTPPSATPHHHHPFPFTSVPNCFIDDFLPHLSPTAQSVMLVLYRLTLGWHRADTFTSLNELRQRTGIASHATLNGALKELLAVGLITVSEQRGLRGLKGYCLTAAALSTTESVTLRDAQTPHNVQNVRTPSDNHQPSSTESVEVPLQNLTPYLYRNRSSTSTESVEVTSSQPAQGAVPDKPKERIKKSKDSLKEIDRYDVKMRLKKHQRKTRTPALRLNS